MYSRDDALKASLTYFNGSELAASVFVDKYALHDSADVFYELIPAHMHRRLAKEFARIEANYSHPLSAETIFGLLDSWTIIPQGSPMSGIGNPYQLQSLSNCFVIESAQDSYGGIFRADQQQAQIMKRRGGVGHDVSKIRPKGVATSNAARTTDGIAIFMDRFSNTTREVAQNGRRGALMLSISCKHPEVETFISIKKDKKRVTGANISIRVDDYFMRAVQSKSKYLLQWPVDSATPSIKREVQAEDIWDQMMQAAWESAEPGILFWDTIIKNSPADCYADVGYKTISTNPCAELPVCADDSCRLLLLNLSKFVIDAYLPTARFDYGALSRAAVVAQRLMDDLIDLELETIARIIKKIEQDPEDAEIKELELNTWKRIYKKTAGGRRTGLGETALADAMAMIGVKYGSDESVSFVEQVHKTIAVASYSSSITMAEERGAFPVFELAKEMDHVFVSKVLAELSPELRQKYANFGRRNIANLTVAPAGSMSIIAQLGTFGYGTASGCEPAFKLQYKRRKKIMSDGKQQVDFTDAMGDKWQEFEVFHLGHLAWAQVNGLDPVKDIELSPYWRACATDIDWVKKIDMQAAAQRWVDHSISNTTNIPADVSVDVVKQIYMHAWESGCKGVTIYRDGTRSGVMVDSKKKTRTIAAIQETNAPKRPERLPCDIHRAKVKGEEWLIFVGLLNERPYEIFCGLASNMDVGKKDKHGLIVKTTVKDESCYGLLTDSGEIFPDIVEIFHNPEHGAMTRMLSTSLRHGVPVNYIVEQLRKDKHSSLFSFSTVVARVLAKSYIADGTKSSAEKKCSECGSTNLSYQQGCIGCIDCGYSKCS